MFIKQNKNKLINGKLKNLKYENLKKSIYIFNKWFYLKITVANDCGGKLIIKILKIVNKILA